MLSFLKDVKFLILKLLEKIVHSSFLVNFCSLPSLIVSGLWKIILNCSCSVSLLIHRAVKYDHILPLTTYNYSCKSFCRKTEYLCSFQDASQWFLLVQQSLMVYFQFSMLVKHLDGSKIIDYLVKLLKYSLLVFISDKSLYPVVKSFFCFIYIPVYFVAEILHSRKQ